MNATAVALFKIVLQMVDKDVADKMLDTIEDRIKATPSKVDDVVVLSVLTALRLALSIPDNDA